MNIRLGGEGPAGAWMIQAALLGSTIGNVVKNTGGTIVLPNTLNGLGLAVDGSDAFFVSWEPTAVIGGVVLTGAVTPFLGTLLVGYYNADNAADKDLTLINFVVNILVVKGDASHS